MTKTNDIYAQDTHPSTFIAEEMVARNWDADDLFAALAPHYPDSRYVLELSLRMYFEVGPTTKNLRMGDPMAKALAAAFNLSVDFWLNLERAWLDDPTQPFKQ